MFTPRQLQLGTQKLKQKNSSVSSQTLRSSASFSPNGASPPEKLRVEGKAKNAPPPALSLFYKYELVSGLELIFSDYSHLDERSAQWLRSREQVENGEGGYIHLASILTHVVFGRTRPAPTQLALRDAVVSCPSTLLELHRNKPLIRRQPKSIPSSSINWASQTIYVEPHVSSLAASSPKLASHLTHNARLPSSHLPIQNVSSRHPAWAFVVLSGPVDDALAAKSDLWPRDWIVMTKSEHSRRDAEYAAMIPVHTRGDVKVQQSGGAPPSKRRKGPSASVARHIKFE